MVTSRFGKNGSSHSMDGVQGQGPTFLSDSGDLSRIPNLPQDCHGRGERCKF